MNISTIVVAVITLILLCTYLSLFNEPKIPIGGNFKYPQRKDYKKLVSGEILRQLISEGKFVVIITNDDLNPDYSSGDLVVISRTIPEKIKRGQYVLIDIGLRKYYIAKICIVHRDGTWTAKIDDGFKLKLHKGEICGIIETKIRRA